MAWTIQVSDWEEVFGEEYRPALEALLPDYLPTRRWFGGKARRIELVQIEEAIPLSSTSSRAYLAFMKVVYDQGAPQTYVLPLSFAYGEQAAQLRETAPGAVVAQLQVVSQDEDLEGPPDVLDGVLYDAIWDEGFALLLLEAIRYGRSFGSSSGEIRAWATEAFERIAEAENSEFHMPASNAETRNPEPRTRNLEPKVVGAEQSNTSIIYGDRFILKMFRRLEVGTSPDLEVGHFLGEHRFTHTPPLAGAIEHHRGEAEPITLAILQGFVPNRGDAWQYTLESLDIYFDRALNRSRRESPPAPALTRHAHVLDLAEGEVPSPGGYPAREAIGYYIDSARLLGKRTAEMHLALASDSSDPAFAPESLTPHYGRRVHESIQGLVHQAFGQLRARLDSLPPAMQAQARDVLARELQILGRFEPLVSGHLDALLTRCHGDYHLGQVLWTGDDFYIIDFEGEPVRSLTERRKKHSPLKDVAGMLRSFHYAANAALFGAIDAGRVQPNDLAQMDAWAASWNLWVSAAYLGEYLNVAGQADFLPKSRNDLRVLLDTYILEKAVYELIYELNNRPDWVRIPLQGIEELVR